MRLPSILVDLPARIFALVLPLTIITRTRQKNRYSNYASTSNKVGRMIPIFNHVSIRLYVFLPISATACKVPYSDPPSCKLYNVVFNADADGACFISDHVLRVFLKLFHYCVDVNKLFVTGFHVAQLYLSLDELLRTYNNHVRD